MKIVFFGTSSFGIPSLEALRTSSHSLVAVVTQPDARGGRSRQLLESPVKRWALEKNVPLLQPADLSDPAWMATLQSYPSDLFILVSYGKILPSSLLKIPPQGGINVHPSLLPKYRGASPVSWAILNGERQTGVSVIRMVEEVDAGDILLQKEVTIGNDEDAVQLSERLSRVGKELLLETLKRIGEGNAPSFPQKGKASFAPRFKKEDGLLDWMKSADTLSRQIRALVPWPGSYSYLRGKRVLIWKAEPEEGKERGCPGEVVDLSREGLFRVATGKGELRLLELQLEGRERMASKSFLIGHPVHLGETFSCHSGKS